MVTPCVLRAGDADLVDRDADQLALVGDQQHFVGVLDRERGDQPPAALGEIVGDQALAAAAGAPVVVGRGALAEAFGRDRQHELLGRAELGDPLEAEG